MTVEGWALSNLNSAIGAGGKQAFRSNWKWERFCATVSPASALSESVPLLIPQQIVILLSYPLVFT